MSKGLKTEIRSHSKISFQIAEDSDEKPDTADNRNFFDTTMIRINSSSNLNKGKRINLKYLDI